MNILEVLNDIGFQYRLDICLQEVEGEITEEIIREIILTQFNPELETVYGVSRIIYEKLI
jgi:hypothetical protein